ncbi:MAG: N-acetyltransferase [Cytophagales bacterium]|nr:MAG: N-acetyltransferase [Cytophagales bacterium]
MLPDLTTLVLETDRLVLKPISPDYTDAIFSEFTPDVATYMYPRPAEQRMETEAFVQSAMADNEDETSLTMVITLRETGEFLGCVGLHKLADPRPEFGIWVKQSAHMHGYGREAIRVLKRWADQYLNYEYLMYPVDSRNIASRKIPESLGAAIVGQFEGTGGMGQDLTLINYRIER